jgi:macrolide-specific efflux system membrane fusion protein
MKNRFSLWIGLGLALLLVGGGGWAYWSYHQAQEQAQASMVPEDLITSAERRDVRNQLLLTGEISPAFSVEIKSEISGKIEQIHVQTGQQVRRGDLLVTIDDKDLLTERSGALTDIAGAQLEVEKRKGNWERAAALFAEKLISKEVFANLEADYRIAQNNLTRAEARLQTVDDRLSKTRLLAPADGTVLDILVAEGQVVVGATSVNAGNVLMNFADLSRLMVRTHVNQMDIEKISPGSKLELKMQGAEAKPVTATVEFVAPVATVKSNIKGFAVEAAIQGTDPRLRPGMSVSLELPVGEAHGAVSVPVAAIFGDTNEDRFVYVRNAGRIERRPVVVGVTNFSHAEIKSGLEEGEKILLVQPPESALNPG